MPKVVREDIDELNAVLTVTIGKTEYETKFAEELKKFQGKSHMKGFRKGKAPLSFLKKMYGKGVLSEVVNEKLQEKLAAFFEKDESNFLGQPIPTEGQDPIEFNCRELEDYVFRFDVGIAPDFEVVGVSEEDEYEQYLVEVGDELITKELENLQKEYGEKVLSDDKIEENGLLKLSVKELEGESLKEKGRESVFSILVADIKNEEVKNEILSKKVGDTFRVNIFELEEFEDEKGAKKHYLQMTEEEIAEGVEVGPFFEATIEESSQLVPAELNQEFYDKVFGEGKVTSEEEAREEIRKNIAAHYERQTESLLFRDFHKTIKKKTQGAIALPEGFLKRWLKLSDKENTKELIEKDFANFAAGLRWSLIRSKLSKKFEIQVSEEEVLAYFRNQISSYFGGAGVSDGNFLDPMVERMMKNQKEVEKAMNIILTEKVFHAVKEVVTINKKSVSLEDFGKIVEEVQREDAPPAELAAAEKISGEEEE